MAILTSTEIPRTLVESSNISGIGFDHVRSILAVQFRSGAVYHYGSVPLEVVTEFSEALSKGQYFGLNIKGKYPGEKMTGSCSACGAKHGWIGETCTDCGTATYAAEARP